MVRAAPPPMTSCPPLMMIWPKPLGGPMFGGLFFKPFLLSKIDLALRGGGAVAVGQVLQGVGCRFGGRLVRRLQELSQDHCGAAGHLQVALGGRFLQRRDRRLSLSCQLLAGRLALLKLCRVEPLDQLLDRLARGCRFGIGCGRRAFSPVGGGAALATAHAASKAKQPTPTNRNLLLGDMVGILSFFLSANDRELEMRQG